MGQLSINEATLANIVREEVTASVEQIARSLRQRQGGGRYRERRPMQCYRCGGFGHLSFDCPNNNRGRGGFSRSNLRGDRNRDSVSRQSNANSSSFYPGFDEKTSKIDPQPLVGTPCSITATYNDCPLDVLLDSGTRTSLISASTSERLVACSLVGSNWVAIPYLCPHFTCFRIIPRKKIRNVVCLINQFPQQQS